MSAKPSQVPTWATDTNYPAGPESYASTPTKSAPLTGRRAIGHEPSQRPPAQEENYDRNLIGAWLQYLNDGDLALHNVTINDFTLAGLNVGAARNVAIANGANNDLDISGGTFVGKFAFALTGGGASAQISGFAKADIENEGRLLIVVNETAADVVLKINDSGSSAANRLMCQAAPSGAVVTMPSKGAFLARYEDGPTGRFEILLANFTIDFVARTRTVDYPPHVYREIGAAGHTLNQNFLGLSTTGGDVIFPVEVAEGDTIVAWTLRMEKVGSSATYVVDLRKVDTTTGTVSTVGSAATNSAVSPGFIVFSQGGLTEVAQHACVYFLRLVGAPNPDNDDLVYGVSVSTTRTGL